MNKETDKVSTITITKCEENHNTIEKCNEWFKRFEISEDEDGTISIIESDETNSEFSYSSYTYEDTDKARAAQEFPIQDTSDTRKKSEINIGENRCFTDESDVSLRDINDTSGNVYKNVLINNSRNVHLGNVTYINGPIYINKKNIEDDNTATNTHTPAIIRMVDRMHWLARSPIDTQIPLKIPAKFVIVYHTATDDSKEYTKNVRVVRLLQRFHIEMKKWSDIAYNFLIGNDGYTYTGRGWNSRGAHSHNYNFCSISIAFVGCFEKQVPSIEALGQARALIEHGVELGKIRLDYSVIGASQISSTCSPGSRLLDEIKSWKNFDDSISVFTPSMMVL